MTTVIKVRSHNWPALVTTIDRYAHGGEHRSTIVLKPEDGEWQGYTTDTRTVEIVDIDPNDPRASKRE